MSSIPRFTSSTQLLKISAREGQGYGIPARIANDETITAFSNWAASNNQSFNQVLTSLINKNAKNVITLLLDSLSLESELSIPLISLNNFIMMFYYKY